MNIKLIIVLLVAFGFVTMILLNLPDFIKNNTGYSVMTAIFLFVPLILGFVKVMR